MFWWMASRCLDGWRANTVELGHFRIMPLKMTVELAYAS